MTYTPNDVDLLIITHTLNEVALLMITVTLSYVALIMLIDFSKRTNTISKQK